MSAAVVALRALDRARMAAVAPNYEAMRVAIERCTSVDEIRTIADKAVAVQAYYRQSLDVENEMNASRIRLRAERRLGDLLIAMKERGERAAVGRPGKSGRGAPILSDLGIPPDRAKRAVQLARVPSAEFEAALAEDRVAQPRRVIELVRSESRQMREARERAGRSLDLWGRLRALGASLESGDAPDPADWAASLQPFQRTDLKRYVPLISTFLDRLGRELRK